jgi:PAS domain S-box-containing protein
MNSPLRILILEDSRDDAELIGAQLAAAAIDCDLTRVETQADFTACLESGQIDLILSDYALPSYDGLSALAAARAQAPNTPFIFVSGAMGEELAIETLKSGATDYVLKQRLSRLVPAVRRAVAEAAEHLARQKAERLLREAREESIEADMKLLEGWPDAMILISADGVIRRVNRQAEALFEYSRDEMVGQPLGILVPQRFREAHIRHVAAYALKPTHRRMGMEKDFVGLRKNGQEFPAAIALIPVETRKGPFFIATVRDITEAIRIRGELVDRAKDLARANEELRLEQQEREKVETELRLAQKLEAIGQLAAGIAHEINTPMQFIGDSVHFLREAFGDLMRLLEAYEEARSATGADAVAAAAKVADMEEAADPCYLRERVPRALERTIEGVERVTVIVRAMKDFSHPSSHDKKPTDLNRAIETALVVSRNEYKYVAEVETEFGQLPEVPCFAGEMNQVFLNLIVNAAHAIGETVKNTDRKGRLRIRTAVDGDMALIAIEDTGTGIPPEIRERIFDPFFTTKPVGKGTGQGLAIAHSIVTGKHGGTLTFDTEVGRGTRFFIRLPIDDGGRQPLAVAS